MAFLSHTAFGLIQFTTILSPSFITSQSRFCFLDFVFRSTMAWTQRKSWKQMIAFTQKWKISAHYAIEDTFTGKKYELFCTHTHKSQQLQECWEFKQGHVLTTSEQTCLLSHTFFKLCIRLSDNSAYAGSVPHCHPNVFYNQEAKIEGNLTIMPTPSVTICVAREDYFLLRKKWH